jgi:methylglutaconyl-CoA hydratase
MVMDIQHIIAVKQPGYIEIWLDRPGKHNALNLEVLDGFIRVFEAVNRLKDVHFVVLRGKGKSFCSGADIHEFLSDKKSLFVEKLSSVFNTIYSLPVPVISIAQGSVYGGGMGLLAASDMVLSDHKTQFCFSEVKLGLIPAIISPYLVSKANIGALRYYMLSALPFDTETAIMLGLVNKSIHVVNEAEIQLFLENMLENGPTALRETKRMLNILNERKMMNEKKELSKVMIGQMLESEETTKGLQAFLHKQQPFWCHKK